MTPIVVVFTTVGLAMAIGVFVEVSAGVGLEVAIGVAVGVAAGVGLEVAIGVAVAVATGAGLAVTLGVGSTLGKGVGTAVTIAVPSFSPVAQLNRKGRTAKATKANAIFVLFFMRTYSERPSLRLVQRVDSHSAEELRYQQAARLHNA